MTKKLLHCYIATLLHRHKKLDKTSKQFNSLTIKQLNNFTSGFTLVELLLYMALVSIFMLTLTDIFTAILDVRTESEATSYVEQDGRFILARMAYDIHGIPANSTITRPDHYGNPTDDTFTWATGFFPITYSLNNGNFQLSSPLGSYNLNSSETTISSLQFKKMGNTGGKETITVQFTVTSKTQRPQGPEAKTFTTTTERR